MAQKATAVRNDPEAAEGGQLVVFQLFGEEFGVDIDQVKEIVRPPGITPIPRSPDFVAGVCNLRGNVLPVIDTRVRFGAEPEGATDHTRLLVVESGGVPTGLIVDSMREVMRMTDAHKEPPPAACKGVDRQFLDGVVKVDDGQRLVMVLDLDEVLAVEAAAGEAATSAPETVDRAGAEAVVSEERQLVSFRVAGEEYAFDIAQVSEIIKITHITTVPNAPAFVKGLFTIRNNLMPIIDLRELLGLPSLASERSAVVEAAEVEHKDWMDNLSHALTANRPFTGILNAKETAFGQWLEAYNSSSIEVETVVKRLKRVRADLFGSAARVLSERKIDQDATQELLDERIRPLLSVTLDELAAFKTAMIRHLLADQRALVMECGGDSSDSSDSSDSVGFLVDWVDEVLRIPKSVIDDAPGLAASERAELRAVAKLDNGERLIMIMDESALVSGEASRLMKDMQKKAGNAKPDTPILYGEGAGGRGAMEEEQLVTFTINREEYAIRIMQVQEINRASEITVVPRAPYFIDGMTNLRGNVLPVINLRKLFGLDDRDMDDRTRIIIVDIDDAKTGIRVDGVNEVLRLPKNQIEKTPSIVVSGAANRYMEGVCKINGGSRIVVLLDVEKILDEKELKALGDLAEDLTPTESLPLKGMGEVDRRDTESSSSGEGAGGKGSGKKKKLEIAE